MEYSAERSGDFLQLEVLSGFLNDVTKDKERPEATIRLVHAAIAFIVDLRGASIPDSDLLNSVCTGLAVCRASRPRMQRRAQTWPKSPAISTLWVLRWLSP